MTPPSKKILVFGATGVIGKVLTSSLLNAGDVFDKVGIFTSAKTVEQKAGLIDGFKARGAQVIVGDANRDEDVLEAYKGASTRTRVNTGRDWPGLVLTKIHRIRHRRVSLW